MDDFTQDAYRELLKQTQQRFNFGKLEDVGIRPKVAVWRHDVDVSPHRALAIAEIDHSMGVQSSFFFQLTSSFYSPFERCFGSVVRELRMQGHIIGLHFDPSTASKPSEESQIERLFWECEVLSYLAGTSISSFSLHNPTVTKSQLLSRAQVGSLTNASWDGWRQITEYCSDSNGYWRFRSAHELVTDPQVDSIYVLTHPEWWLPASGTPFEAISRAVNGRRERTLMDYRKLLSEHGRVLFGDGGSGKDVRERSDRESDEPPFARR